MSRTPSAFRLQILMDDKEVEGALWNRSLLGEEDEHGSIRYPDFRLPAVSRFDDRGLLVLPEDIVKVAVSIDPAITDPDLPKNRDKDPDETGILVGGITNDGRGKLLGDFSGVHSPATWGQIVAKAARVFGADVIVYESNQGGDLVRDNVRRYVKGCQIKGVHATIGKRARAEPVAGLYEDGIMHHCGHFPMLESQMCSWNARDPGARSPNRIDALVWLWHGLGLCDVQPARQSSRASTNPNLR